VIRAGSFIQPSRFGGENRTCGLLYVKLGGMILESGLPAINFDEDVDVEL
jgi:hypothetical protein